jgi:predicted HicB family RNase H-like nuclease
MNLTINVSEELYRRAAEIAAEENVSVEELIASAFEERIIEFNGSKKEQPVGTMRDSDG